MVWRFSAWHLWRRCEVFHHLKVSTKSWHFLMSLKRYLSTNNVCLLPDWSTSKMLTYSAMFMLDVISDIAFRGSWLSPDSSLEPRSIPFLKHLWPCIHFTWRFAVKSYLHVNIENNITWMYKHIINAAAFRGRKVKRDQSKHRIWWAYMTARLSNEIIVPNEIVCKNNCLFLSLRVKAKDQSMIMRAYKGNTWGCYNSFTEGVLVSSRHSPSMHLN